MKNLKKLIGLNIDTNQYKNYGVKADEIAEVYANVCKFNRLNLLRRVQNGNTFTTYTYHFNEDSLGETLDEYLEITRHEALSWWNKLQFCEQVKLVNSTFDYVRNPLSLTGREIEEIYVCSDSCITETPLTQ